LERYEESLEAYRAALALDADNVDARAGAVWCELRLGRRRAAQALFMANLEEHPEHESSTEGARASRLPLGVDLEMRPFALVGSKVLSTQWGGGFSTAIGLRLDAFRLRLGYRFSRLRPPDLLMPGLPPQERPTTDAHFVGGGADYSHRRFEVGLFGGYATAELNDWSAGLLALHSAANVWLKLSLDFAAVIAGPETVYQLTPRLTFPVRPWLDLWAGAHISIEVDEGTTGAGEAGLRVNRERWGLDLWGRYGLVVTPFAYGAAVFYDYDEDFTWGAGATVRLGVNQSISLTLGYEIAGTRIVAPDGSNVDGVLSTVMLGAQLNWRDRNRQATETRSEP